ncbi:hypothetical protein [Phormidium nigroviride]|nr:hypothetical protein [Oscillatoria nigro-viridis]
MPKFAPNLSPDDATGNDMICGTNRRGFQPPSHSSSRLKPTENSSDDAAGNDMICGTNRRGFQPPSHSSSRLKPTENSSETDVDQLTLQSSFRGLSL